ncbi:MAG: preprotein translocase subunit SecE [Acetobacteraceae bacterium]|nr:preprotein translocase subunit SecE [Acetobacteraceae bacterium]
MNDEIKVPAAGTPDKAKLVVSILLLLGGIAGYYVLGNQPLWQRWLAVVAGVVLAAAILIPSQYGRALKQFVLDSRVELRKIVWPSRRETGMTTLVVFLFVVVAGIFFYGVDLVLAWATRHLTGQGG